MQASKDAALAAVTKTKVQTAQANQAAEAAGVGLAKLRQTVAAAPQLPPRQQALLHWGRMYLEQAESFTALKTKLLTRGLWLKLIKARLLGPGTPPSGDIDGDELVGLAVRVANLEKTEKHLASTLDTLLTRRQDLTTHYHSLEVITANRSAGHSLNYRLGVNVVDALRSRTLQNLATYVRPEFGSAERRSAASEAAQRYRDKSSSLLGLCRSLVLSRLRDPAAKSNERVADKFSQAMRQLDDLERDARTAYLQADAPAPAVRTARPKVIGRNISANLGPGVVPPMPPDPEIFL